MSIYINIYTSIYEDISVNYMYTYECMCTLDVYKDTYIHICTCIGWRLKYDRWLNMKGNLIHVYIFMYTLMHIYTQIFTHLYSNMCIHV